MNFSLQGINEAHRKFTGVDFPKLIQEFKLMGMLLNIYDIQTGLVTYEHKNGERIEVQSQAVDISINTVASTAAAHDVLKRHQAGETDFSTFCKEIAGAGIYKWVSDMEKMTCSYYDLKENVVLAEAIPKI